MIQDTFLFTNKMGYHRGTEDYLLPYTALAYAQELKRRGYDVLLIIDEIQEHLLKEILIFHTAKVPVVTNEQSTSDNKLILPKAST